MDEKQPQTDPLSTGYVANQPVYGERPLKIKQIRALCDYLLGLETDDPLPDWSRLSLAQRFAVVSRIVPSGQREATLGKSETQLRRYESGAEIPFNVISTLSKATMLPIDWIAEGKMDVGDQPADSEYDVPVQQLAFRASAGPGSLAIDENAGFMRVPRTILARNGVKQENARLIEAQGESMRSTINDGDLLVVDIGDTTIAEGKVYVFSIGDDVFVKRLRRTGERVMVRADNQELFPGEEPVPHGLPFRVYGRVKWAGRNL